MAALGYRPAGPGLRWRAGRPVQHHHEPAAHQVDPGAAGRPDRHHLGLRQRRPGLAVRRSTPAVRGPPAQPQPHRQVLAAHLHRPGRRAHHRRADQPGGQGRHREVHAQHAARRREVRPARNHPPGPGPAVRHHRRHQHRRQAAAGARRGACRDAAAIRARAAQQEQRAERVTVDPDARRRLHAVDLAQ